MTLQDTLERYPTMGVENFFETASMNEQLKLKVDQLGCKISNLNLKIKAKTKKRAGVSE